VPSHFGLLGPAKDRVAGQFGPIVADDRPGPAAPSDQKIEFAGHSAAGQRDVGYGRKAFPGAIVKDRKDAESATARHLQPTDWWLHGTHPTSAVLSEAWYFAKRVTLSLALRSSGDAGRGFGRVGAATALVAG
jgi:hypothetical protein